MKRDASQARRGPRRPGATTDEAVHRTAGPGDSVPCPAAEEPLLRLPFSGPLLPGRLLCRRDRFLAEVELAGGERVVAHCVNTGRMEGLTLPGRAVWLSHNPRPGRRLVYTWELIEVGGRLIGANTAMPNLLVRRLLEERRLPPFQHHSELRPERPFGERSRVDFWLRQDGVEHYLEVKNCHLVYEDRRGYFPDSVSERATHHMAELSAVCRAGHRAAVLLVVQREDAEAVRPSDAHDPAFAVAARAAARAGVRFLGLRVRPTLTALEVLGPIPVDLEPYEMERPAAWRDKLRAEAPAWVQTRRKAAEAPKEPERQGPAGRARKRKVG